MIVIRAGSLKEMLAFIGSRIRILLSGSRGPRVIHSQSCLPEIPGSVRKPRRQSHHFRRISMFFAVRDENSLNPINNVGPISEKFLNVEKPRPNLAAAVKNS